MGECDLVSDSCHLNLDHSDECLLNLHGDVYTGKRLTVPCLSPIAPNLVRPQAA